MHKRILRSTILTLAVLGVRLLCLAVTLVLLARLLGPALYGAYAALAAVALLIGALAPLGTHLTLMRDLARGESVVHRLPLAVGTTLVVGGGAVLIFAIAADLTSTIPLAVILFIGVGEALLQPLVQVYAATWSARERVGTAQMYITLPLVLRAIWVSVLAAEPPEDPLMWYAMGHVGAAAIALIVICARVGHVWETLSRMRLLPKGEWRGNAGFAVLALTAAGPSELDKAIAPRVMPLVEAGGYSAASRVSAAMVLPVIALLMSLLPGMFKRSPQLMGIGFRWGLLALTGSYGALAGVAVYLVAPWLALAFGEDYMGVEMYLHGFAFIVPAMCMRLSAASTLMSFDQPWLRASVELAGMLLLVVMALYFSRDPIPGAMLWAVGIVEYAMAIAGWVLVMRLRSGGPQGAAPAV